MSSKTKKVLTLTTEEVEEIEKTTKICDPGELVVEYLQMKILQLENLLEEYKELKNAPEKIKVLGRKRIALAAREVGAVLTAPTKSTRAIVDAEEEQRKKYLSEVSSRKAPIDIVC